MTRMWSHNLWIAIAISSLVIASLCFASAKTKSLHAISASDFALYTLFPQIINSLEIHILYSNFPWIGRCKSVLDLDWRENISRSLLYKSRRKRERAQSCEFWQHQQPSWKWIWLFPQIKKKERKSTKLWVLTTSATFLKMNLTFPTKSASWKKSLKDRKYIN